MIHWADDLNEARKQFEQMVRLALFWRMRLAYVAARSSDSIT